MNFSTDRDLLAVEPGLFAEAPLSGQERMRVSDGVVTGTQLSTASGNLQAAGVEAGSVLLVAAAAVEVIELVNAHTAVVSLLRASLGEAAIPPGDGVNREVVARTFEPQAALAHDQLLQMLGIDPDDALQAGMEDAIVSLSVMQQLEVLGTLHRVYAGAVSLAGEEATALWQKAVEYQRQFSAACRSAKVKLDLDGDGYADTTRVLGVITMRRG